MTVPDWKDEPSFADVGVRWLTDEESEAELDALRDRHAHMPLGTLWPGDTWEHACEMADRVVPIMAGPAFPSGSADLPLEAIWFLDSDTSTLWVALSADVAPILWLECERAPEAVVELARRIAPRDASRTRRFRALMGDPHELLVPGPYSGELVAAEPHQLTNYWLLNPYRPDDPLSSAVTTFSNSLVRCEYHPALSVYVWDMEYAPASFESKIEELNAMFNAKLPLDLPLDVVGCVLGFRVDTEAVLTRELETCPLVDAGRITYWLRCVAAVRCEDPELATLLESYASHPHPNVRYTAAMAAFDAGLGELFATIRERETDPELYSDLEQYPVPSEPQVVRHAIG